ncbi:UDP-galactopyranose mutase [bioreactor metagenome]|uniref:UDP-galactopyranose mutase n=1 Tax=bioreactor metagenome TaxID=1076179 RepID=A0A645A0Q6_9ZZZZ|nr:UDP-galactopyranose mutase [Erysipelotrichaceae bacterium]
MKNYDVIIVGAGFAGSVMAERFAGIGKKVLLIDKRSHIGGNMYDYLDENGVLVHRYGPHLFHCKDFFVLDYLRQFSDWYDYQHRVMGYVNGKIVPIPFNLHSIDLLFEKDEADKLKETLINEYGMEQKVPILVLRQSPDPKIRKLAEFIYEKVFKYYTMKQWDLTPEEIDPKVTERVPVFVSYDDRYFQDEYQFLPKEGYTKIFEKMLNHPNIDVILNTKAEDVLKINFEEKKIYYQDHLFEGRFIFTGQLDELMKYRYGKLAYRSLYFDLQSHDGFYQETATVNYPTPKEEHAFTRITEFKHLMQNKPAKTTIAIEYPYPYEETAKKGNIPYYPVFTTENETIYGQYVNSIKDFTQLILLGRLAEFRYYNMDAIVKRSLEKFEELKTNIDPKDRT